MNETIRSNRRSKVSVATNELCRSIRSDGAFPANKGKNRKALFGARYCLYYITFLEELLVT